MGDIRELNNVSLPYALDDKKNYIYIQDAKRENDYYCPCCGKELITAAIDEDKEYKVPAYYRHKPKEKCDAESLAHWVYKIWLFDKGSQFYVYDGTNKDLYIVDNIELEKTFHTDFGNYRPDITITTTDNKVFFFEINFSSPKRSDDYYCKWWEINNDVIEVDIEKLQKESYHNRIPTFKLIYSNGICYDSKYNRKDVFAGITKEIYDRKEEIKRQDILNYKTVWERLDWFWNEIKKYKALKSTMDDVLDSFRNVPYEEMELCFNIVRRISCINNNQGFRDIVNQNFNVYINNLLKKYNDKTTNMAVFSIVKDDYYKTVWNIKIETAKKVGIMKNSTHKESKQLTWKKHIFPYSLYLKYENIICNYFEQLLYHFNIVNRINECVCKSISKEDYDSYIAKDICCHYTSNLLYSEDFIEKYKNDVISCIRNQKYYENDHKISDAIKKFNADNHEYKYEYYIKTDNDKHIYQIVLTLYSTKYKDTLSKAIKICHFTMDNEDSVKFLSSTRSNRIKTLRNFTNNQDTTNIIDVRFSEIISVIKKEAKSKCNYLFLDYKCIDIFTVKFRISVRMNHGDGWNRDYRYYCGKYIELKNNNISDANISNMSDSDLCAFVLTKLFESKNEALRKFRKLDGINNDTRFILEKEDINAKADTI